MIYWLIDRGCRLKKINNNINNHERKTYHLYLITFPLLGVYLAPHTNAQAFYQLINKSQTPLILFWCHPVQSHHLWYNHLPLIHPNNWKGSRDGCTLSTHSLSRCMLKNAFCFDHTFTAETRGLPKSGYQRGSHRFGGKECTLFVRSECHDLSHESSFSSCKSSHMARI